MNLQMIMWIAVVGVLLIAFIIKDFPFKMCWRKFLQYNRVYHIVSICSVSEFILGSKICDKDINDDDDYNYYSNYCQ